MNPNTVAAVAAAIAAVAAALFALVALPFTIRAANAAKAQTELQRLAVAEARLPMLWADIRPDTEHRAVICLYVGNSGPTTARNVRAVVSPPIVPGPFPMSCEAGQDAAAAGIASLPPGRVLSWALGIGSELLSVANQPEVVKLTLTGAAPDGTELADELTIRLGDIRTTRATPGNLEELVQEFKHARRERREHHRAMLDAVRSAANDDATEIH
ncbi:hypothetical protein [Cellulomonas hominis]|uniref:hypothetical protein n=1 Tax=Cellulomonas hominis TaxID=156981 RepID=UPI001BCDAE6B|nr:hypothetical protein [Cellulomonas hominis]